MLGRAVVVSEGCNQIPGAEKNDGNINDLQERKVMALIREREKKVNASRIHVYGEGVSHPFRWCLTPGIAISALYPI